MSELVAEDDKKIAGGKPVKRKASGRQKDGNVGQTLRNAYQQTVNEDIPSEMLDLLGKLA